PQPRPRSCHVPVGSRGRWSASECVVVHRLIKVDGAARRHVKACNPHGADEHEPERVLCVLETGLKVLLLHPLSMGEDVEELRTMFGDEIASLVLEMTDDKSLPKMECKRLQIEHAQHTSRETALVKLADKICNLRDVAV